MTQAIEGFTPPHFIFEEATSIEHFVELLRGYHAMLMAARPENERYELAACQTRFEFHPVDDPNYCVDKAWGEYHFRLSFKFKQQGTPFAAVKRDFPFMMMLSSQGNGRHTTGESEELHGTSIELEYFPKMQAEFEALQELNKKHEAHVRKLNVQTQESCDSDAELQKVRARLNSHQVSVYLLEAEEKRLMERIAADIKTTHPEPDAQARVALLQKFPER